MLLNLHIFVYFYFFIHFEVSNVLQNLKRSLRNNLRRPFYGFSICIVVKVLFSSYQYNKKINKKRYQGRNGLSCFRELAFNLNFIFYIKIKRFFSRSVFLRIVLNVKKSQLKKHKIRY